MIKRKGHTNMNTNNPVAAFIKKLGKDKLDLYLQLNFESDKGRIVFAGDSLIEYFPFSELYHGEKIIYNRGIAGSTTYDVLSRADTLILPLQPSKLFLLVGTNDVMLQPKNNNEKSIAMRILEICDHIAVTIPKCRIYPISLLPINLSNESKIYKAWQIGKDNKKIMKVNSYLSNLCLERGYEFINLYPCLVDQNGQLDIEFTIDGTHINIKAYKRILELLIQYF